MFAVAKDLCVKGKTLLILKATASQLTGQALLEITEIAEHAHAELHISHNAWQILVGVPEIYRPFVEKELEDLGYDFNSYTKGPYDPPTFWLKKCAA